MTCEKNNNIGIYYNYDSKIDKHYLEHMGSLNNAQIISKKDAFNTTKFKLHKLL